jgi:acyl-CoA dehydrogenase
MPLAANLMIKQADSNQPGASLPKALVGDLKTRTRIVAAVAAEHADVVDSEARFPSESFEVARARRLLGVMIPKDLGGEGASLRDVANICYALGRACASTGMIYAMHQTKLACLIRHGRGAPWHERFLARVCDKQLLLASSTTEGKEGGNIRSSAAAVEGHGEQISLERAATVISYGLAADGIVTTARRDADALDSDQVLVVLLKEDYFLDQLGGWNTLGMRGTCSAGFTLRAKGSRAQILPEPYAKIHVQTMVPTSHLLWASVWTGIAASAVERARLFLRNAARHADGRLPPGAAHFTRATANLKTLRALVNDGVRKFEGRADDAAAVASIDFQTAMNMLKVEASELAVSICLGSLRACGLSGYRNDGDHSVSRHLRDALSSPIMINNDRILANIATSALLDETSASLLD